VVNDHCRLELELELGAGSKQTGAITQSSVGTKKVRALRSARAGFSGVVVASTFGAPDFRTTSDMDDY
jgi:hypothetical protein